MSREIPQGREPGNAPSPGAASEEDEAFLQLMDDIWQRLEAMRLAYPEGRHRTAIEAMQRAGLELAAAVTRLRTP